MLFVMACPVDKSCKQQWALSTAQIDFSHFGLKWFLSKWNYLTMKSNPSHSLVCWFYKLNNGFSIHCSAWRGKAAVNYLITGPFQRFNVVSLEFSWCFLPLAKPQQQQTNPSDRSDCLEQQFLFVSFFVRRGKKNQALCFDNCVTIRSVKFYSNCRT